MIPPEGGHIRPVAEASYPLRAGNRVRPLIDSVPAYRRISEAVEAARHSVWLTVTFFATDFELPDGRGTVFDLLDRAVARGLDVRAIFWRPNPESSGYGRTFAGTPEDFALLRSRDAGYRIRWDRAPAAFCQHQKSWLIDAGQPSETAFVGGINLTYRAVGNVGHAAEGERHDIYVEVTGPSATDVHHNFVQRWNEASERDAADGAWHSDGDDMLRFPDRVSAGAGATAVQIQRMVAPERYRNGHPSPGAGAFEIVRGERAVLAQYVEAFAAAKRSIYIENQALPIPLVAKPLEAALARGVRVVMLTPAEPEEHVRKARRNPANRAHFDQIAALGRYPNFTLAGIACQTPQGRRSPIYVHAKIMLVDDAWATIGSCNLHWNSLNGHSEMNASFWDAAAVRDLRRALFQEHLDRDTAALDDLAALALFRKIAAANRERHDAGDPDWQGLAFTLDPATYGA